MAVRETHKFNPDTGEFVLVQDNRGHEVPDPKPLEVPAGFKKPELLADTVRRLVRSEQFQRDLDNAGLETFDDADDFEVDDDFDPSTPYETFFDPVLGKEITPLEFKTREEHYKSQYVKASQEYYKAVDRDGVLQDNLLRARHRTAKAGGEGGSPPSQAKPEAPKDP